MTQLTDLREALEARLPIGPLRLNVSIENNVAAVSIQCGALSWERHTGLGYHSSEQIAETIETELREHLQSALTVLTRDVKEEPRVRLRRSAARIKDLMGSPEGQPLRDWLEAA